MRAPAARLRRKAGLGPSSYNADLCRATQRLRARLSEALARIDALEAELRITRAGVAAERSELTAHLEGPEATRDVLLIAQDLLRSEMVEAAARHALCAHCGGLGRGMTNGLLVGRINDHCAAHDLPSASEPLSEADWPSVPAGRWRDPAWLRKPDVTRSGHSVIW